MQVAPGYSDYNRMKSKTSTMGAGIVSGKAFLDMDWIAEAMANGDDKSKTTYPGGSKEENHDAMPGYLSFGLKCVRAEQGSEGDTNELGVVSVAGLCTDDYASHRSIEGQWYFQGVVTTEQRVSGHHMDANTHDPHHGYATIRVGMANTPNNGPYMLYAGQLACWRIPPSNLSVTRLDEDNTMDTTVNNRARNGDPNTMFRFELVPFDARDFTMYTAGALATMEAQREDPTQRGIANVPFSEFFRWQGITEVPTVTCEQEEAAGRKYGFVGAGLAFVETMAQLGYITINDPANIVEAANKPQVSANVRDLAAAIGLWDLDANPSNRPWFKALENMFFMDLLETQGVDDVKQNFQRAFGITPAEAGRIQTVTNNANDNYLKLRVHLSRFTDGAIMGPWYDKTSKIVGRAANTTAPGDMAHLLVGHTAI